MHFATILVALTVAGVSSVFSAPLPSTPVQHRNNPPTAPIGSHLLYAGGKWSLLHPDTFDELPVDQHPSPNASLSEVHGEQLQRNNKGPPAPNTMELLMRESKSTNKAKPKHIKAATYRKPKDETKKDSESPRKLKKKKRPATGQGRE